MSILALLFPVALGWSLGLCALALILAWVRRPALPATTLALSAIGLVLLCLAAADLSWRRPASQSVLVRVDLSPSTRGAAFRDPSQLLSRLRSLLGERPYRIEYFADGLTPAPADGSTLADAPADRTRYPAADADAVLLLSDCRFVLPVFGPPTYPIVDPLLENPKDAAVTQFEMRGNDLAVTVNNRGPTRLLTLPGAAHAAEIPSDTNLVVTRPARARPPIISAELSPGDLWPENDGLVLIPPPPAQSQRWWIGSDPPPSPDWRAVAPDALPADAASYLGASVIVLDNVPAGVLRAEAQERLGQYVRDLGGGLVILGGDRAFGAGGYVGSVLETLSPLASAPPAPTTHWMLLADSSGSMSEAAGGSAAAGISRWRLASDAVVSLLPHLPPEDLVSVGDFAKELRWWSQGKSAHDTAALSLPPPSVGPSGPTNLEPALLDIIGAAENTLPKQLLLLTDADATIDDPAGIVVALKRKNVHLHLLAIGEGQGLSKLDQLVRSTGGTLVRELDPSKWSQGIAQLMRTASPDRLTKEPITGRFVGELSSLDPVQIAPWDRTWLKSSATLLAEGTLRPDADHPPLLARWTVGAGGRVVSSAFALSGAPLDAVVRLVEAQPHDPRFRVSWNTGVEFRVGVDATDARGYLNDQLVALELRNQATGPDAAPAVHALQQTGPGHYDLSIPAPRVASIATVRVAGQIIDRIAVAGRYAPEFDAIGNDRNAMETLAHKTGGRVIEPSDLRPIDFNWPRRSFPATPWLAVAGAAMLALGLGYWRLR